MKDHVFGHGTTTRTFGSLDRLKVAKGEEEKDKEKARAKEDSKELVTHTLVKNKHKTMIGGQKKIVFGGEKGRKAEKAFRKERANYPISILGLFLKEKVPTRRSSQTKERVKNRVDHILNQGSLPLNRQMKKDMDVLGSLTIGIRILLMTLPVQLQEELLHGMARDILHGWRQFL